MFRGVMRHHVSQNVDAITGTRWLNRFDITDSLYCMYLIDRFLQLLRCEVALHFINAVTHSTCSTSSVNGNYKFTNLTSLFIFKVL